MTRWLLPTILALTCVPNVVQAGPPVRFSLGLNFGVPYYSRPYWHPYHGYRYYYAAPPVVYAPAPIVVQQPPTVIPVPAPVTAAPAPVPAQAVAPASVIQANHAGTPAGAEQFLFQLNDSAETVRRDAVMALGRMRATQAIEPIASLLRNDSSPAVRDAAARSLGLIGSPQCLTALTYAAQADQDRDVRRSAQFAVEVIRAGMRR